MAQALPATKLAGLLVKTLAKPVSKRIKHEFSRYEWTKRMLIGIGQTTHIITSRMTIWSAGYRVRSIKKLDPEQALANGADLFGESLVFLVSGGVVVYEYNRSKEKEEKAKAEKAAQTRAEHAAMRAKLQSLDLRLKAVEAVVKSNSESILNLGLGGSRYVEPSKDALVPIVDDEEEREFEEKIAKEAGGDKSSNAVNRSSASGLGPAVPIPPAAHNPQDSTETEQLSDAQNKPWWKIW